ncbi:ISAs1 family transposase, partial [Streptococcus pyogenes]
MEELQENAQYYQNVENSRGQIEVREYSVSSDIKWLCQNHPKGHKLRGFGITRNTIAKDGQLSQVHRYFN